LYFGFILAIKSSIVAKKKEKRKKNVWEAKKDNGDTKGLINMLRFS
jgi:hypothetical protein